MKKIFWLTILALLCLTRGAYAQSLPIFWSSATGFQSRGVTYQQLSIPYNSVTAPNGVPQTDGTAVLCTGCAAGVNNLCIAGAQSVPAYHTNGVWICGQLNAGFIGSVPDPLSVNSIVGKGVHANIGIYSGVRNGALDVMAYGGAVPVAAAWQDGTTTATSTNFVSASNHFTNAMVGMYVRIPYAAKGTDWVANKNYTAIKTYIQPSIGNAGHYTFVDKIKGIASAGPVTWCQTQGCTVVDGGVTWTNTGATGTDLITTITTFNSASSVTLATAADWSMSGTWYDIGPDSTSAFTATWIANVMQNGTGAVTIPCGYSFFIKPLTFTGKGVEMYGCGFGPAFSSTGVVGDSLISIDTTQAPMITTQQSYRFYLHDIRLVGAVAPAGPQAAAIQFCDGTTCGGTQPPQEYMHIENVYMGGRGTFAALEPDNQGEFVSCLDWEPPNVVGAGNNGPGVFINNHCSGWLGFARDLSKSSQFINNAFYQWQEIGSTLDYEDGSMTAATEQTTDNTPTHEATGNTVYELQNGAGIDVVSSHTELTDRYVTCNMAGLGSMGGSIHFENSDYQQSSNIPPDNLVVACGSTTPVGGPIVGHVSVIFVNQGFSFNAGKPYVNGPSLIGIDGGSGPYNGFFGEYGVQAVGPAQIVSATHNAFGHSVIDINTYQPSFGAFKNYQDVTGTSGVYDPNMTEAVQATTFLGGATLGQQVSPSPASAPCTVNTGSGTTCLYAVSIQDPNTGETVAISGGSNQSCNGAAAGSTNNTLHYAPVTGAYKYCLYRNNCAGGGTYTQLVNGCFLASSSIDISGNVNLTDFHLALGALTTKTASNYGGLYMAGSAPIGPGVTTFANLPAILTANGMNVYCSDCKNSVDNAATVGAACASGGSGAMAVKIGATNHCY